MKKAFSIRSFFERLATKRRSGFGKRRQNAKAESLESRLLLTATLEGFVWNDANDNGIQDDGLSGIDGVAVDIFYAGPDGIFDGSEDPIVGLTTAGGGLYSYTGDPGKYKVTFYPVTGYTRTAPNVGANDTIDSDANVGTGITQIYTLGDGETNNTVDAGYTQRAAIGDFVWNDLDSDGIQDTLEPGISNVTVNLKNDLGQIIDTTTTDADGMYWFTNIVPGAYSVQFVQPPGFSFASPPNSTDPGSDDDRGDSDADPMTGMTVVYQLLGGQYDDTIDAGYYNSLSLPSLGDFVWDDQDSNGRQDPGEPGINGVTVTLIGAGLDNQFGTGDDTIIFTTTGNNGTNDGAYFFANLDPGQYQVTFSNLPAGYVFTTPNVGDDTRDSDADPMTGTTGIYVLNLGDRNSTVDAGAYRPASIGNYTWIDTNGDGQQNLGEPGLNGVQVTLTGAGLDGTFGTGDDTSAMQNTANDGINNGAYKFSGLVPGQYKVTFGPSAMSVRLLTPAQIPPTQMPMSAQEDRDLHADQRSVQRHSRCWILRAC
ncbi:MAG: SdrD B-like domain-containing protein [Planctomycetaceae bacterium]